MPSVSAIYRGPMTVDICSTCKTFCLVTHICIATLPSCPWCQWVCIALVLSVNSTTLNASFSCSPFLKSRYNYFRFFRKWRFDTTFSHHHVIWNHSEQRCHVLPSNHFSIWQLRKQTLWWFHNGLLTDSLKSYSQKSIVKHMPSLICKYLYTKQNVISVCLSRRI